MSRSRAPLVVLLTAVGCVPSLEGEPWRVDGPRVVAVRATPAEAPPDAVVRLEALVVGDAAGPARFALCLAPRGPEERRVAAEPCLLGAADALLPLPAFGPTEAEARLPLDACQRFGPLAPPSEAGAEPRRPTDPDGTGGYHQPVVVELDGARSIGRVRLDCGLPAAPARVAARWRAEARPNRAPDILALELDDGRPADGARLAPGVTLGLVVRTATDAAERWLAYAPGTRSLEARRERLSVQWFADGGRLDAHARGLEPDRAESGVDWTTPDTAGPVRIWAVLRDDRGGVSWVQVRLEIAP